MSHLSSLRTVYVYGIALFLIPVSTFGCATHSDHSSEIKIENERWAEAYAKGDYEAIGKLYTHNGKLLPPGEGGISGQQAIAEYFKKIENNPHGTVRFSDLEFYSDSKTVTEISNTEIRNHEGKILSRGKQTLIFLKQNGMWKLHRDMWN
ncbi:DUF4440 domain-containing protein [Candidatus Pantoea formicae]|uniref:YybH family protein n=1 Tax=Candidatus Pantoea formicae TaxID=2608355 RepID=UPI003EDA2495